MKTQTNASRKGRPKSTKQNQALMAEKLRRDLALAVMVLVALLAVIATAQTGAMPVLDKMLPLLALVFGFFFAHKSGRL